MYVCVCVCVYMCILFQQTENFLIISEHVFLQDIQRIQIVNSCQKNLIVKKFFFLVKRYKNNRLFGLLCDCKEISIRVTNNVI